MSTVDALIAIRARIVVLSEIPTKHAPLQPAISAYNALLADRLRVRQGFKPTHGLGSLVARRQRIEADLTVLEAAP